MIVSELIERLKQKDPTAEIEFVIVKTDGEIVTCEVGKQVKAMTKFLKLFAE